MSSARRPSNNASEFDDQMMRRALALARRGEGRVEPNPMVGCVVTRGEKVLGEGYHRRFGGPHAEVNALRACRGSVRGATVYVSLEPCHHHGKTPPCTRTLIDAGVSRVVVGVSDPSSVVNGRGIRALRRAGIAVDVGVMRDRATELIAPFATLQRLGRPYVIAKWAQSIDGKVATRTKDARWISCEASRRAVHRLRARADAVLVGSGTVKADDPMLTARDVRIRRHATRVVLDSSLTMPPRCQLITSARAHATLVFSTAAAAKSGKAERLRRAGVEVVGVRANKGHVSLAEVLKRLGLRGMTNVLVEAGPTVTTGLLRAGLVDEVLVFVAPMLIGGVAAPSAIVGKSPNRIADVIKPQSVTVKRSGQDMLYRMRMNDRLNDPRIQ